MTVYNYEYRADGGYGYGRQSGDFTATSDKVAKNLVFRKLAVEWTTPKYHPSMDDRIEKVKEIVLANSLSLENRSTGDQFEWTGSVWKTRKEIEEDIEADRKRREKDEERGYREVNGLILPPQGLGLYPVVDASGETPEGSSGYAHYSNSEGAVIQISDGSTVGRFWPAIWDKDKRRWEVTGEGVQMKEGRVAETFPVSVQSVRTDTGDLQSIESSRSERSRSSDESQEHSIIVEPDDPRVEQWKRDQGRMDVRGIDTPKGQGRKRKIKSPPKRRPKTILGGMR